MGRLERHPARVGQHLAHLVDQVVAVVLAEVVEDDEAALLQVATQARGFGGHSKNGP